MKRRNADCGKIRRPIKRSNKITEGMCSSFFNSTTILFLKFLILWTVVMAADFMFMFRFEFLWPFWLLLRSVHDSFKYKGLAFSVLFVCIAITSDLVCLFFIPVHWLLLAASTYVWVQYVWHADKGLGLPTIVLWATFIYLEAGYRFRDSRHTPHLDLCRPFAAHCIGYPVVTLGFGFKSYVGYRMRQRKQREVSKENEFYLQLLQQALPPQEETLDDSGTQSSSTTTTTTTITNSSSLQNAVVTVSIAQTVQTNSITGDHHHNNISSTSNNDDKNNQLIAQQTIQVTNSTAISSSSNRNAQTNSKLNNINNTTTSNGHIGNNLNGLTSHKNHRRSMDKDKHDLNHQTNTLNNNNSNNSKTINSITTTTTTNGDIYTNNNNNITNSSSKLSNSYMNNHHQLPNSHVQKDLTHLKDKDNWESCTSSSASSTTSSINSGKDSNTSNKFYTNTTNSNYDHTINEKKSHPNGNVVNYDAAEIVEPLTTERVKSRRNRNKRDANVSSKDNHNQNNNNSVSHHHKDSNTSLDSSSTISSTTSTQSVNNGGSISSPSATSIISNVASQVVTKICDACVRFENEIKRYRNEINHMKQIENDLRQKLDANSTTKSCLQAKQRDYDDLEKRFKELTNIRQFDLVNLQNVERRLGEERRQRQSIEAQLNNEKKAKKLAEEKAARQDCSEACKQRKQQIDNENKQLRREMKSIEDGKQAAEQQGRKYEQELRRFEVEFRNREAQQGTEVLMSALAAMQDKNSTLEKNLSAETRVKLDLFSALGEAKRQLEIKDNMVRSKDEEVLDLKAKIAQLLAVMPTDSLCLPPCSTTGSSMLRMNDTPPLQGPSSPMMGALNATHQQIITAHQLNARGVGNVVSSSVVTSSTNGSSSCITNVTSPSSMTGNGTISKNGNKNCGGSSGGGSGNVGNITGGGGGVINNILVTQTSSNLDPNATAYTPKNSTVVNGTGA